MPDQIGVLVAEDEELVRLVIAEALRDVGLEVMECEAPSRYCLSRRRALHGWKCHHPRQPLRVTAGALAVNYPIWTQENLLRQVVYLGLREDKPPREVQDLCPIPGLPTWHRNGDSGHPTNQVAASGQQSAETASLPQRFS